jgi:hypothetical protein
MHAWTDTQAHLGLARAILRAKGLEYLRYVQRLRFLLQQTAVYLGMKVPVGGKAALVDHGVWDAHFGAAFLWVLCSRVYAYMYVCLLMCFQSYVCVYVCKLHG